MVDAVFFFKTQTWREAGGITGDCMQHCIFRAVFFLKYYIGYYGVTRNEDGFERPHLNALGGILQRTVGLSDNELICRTVNPTQYNKTFKMVGFIYFFKPSLITVKCFSIICNNNKINPFSFVIFF